MKRAVLLFLMILALFTTSMAEEQDTAYTVDDTPKKIPGQKEYVIKPGDTLWDISSEYFGNPWFWRKLWQANPYIENPDLIYPNNKLSFDIKGLSTSGTVMSGVEVTNNENTEGPTGLDLKAAVSGQEKEKESEDLKLVSPTEKIKSMPQDMKIVGKSVISFISRPYINVRYNTFILKDKPAPLSRIIKPRIDKLLITTSDMVYLEPNNKLEVGKEYSIYRVLREVRIPPKNEEHFGWVILVVGRVVIRYSDENTTIGEITQSFERILSGDLIGDGLPYQLKKVYRIKNKESAQGILIDSVEDKILFGEGSVVFVTIGQKDGLIPGNTLEVFRNISTSENTPGIQEFLGEMRVIGTTESSATCIITMSTKEFKEGDTVVLRPGY